jgi:hypothetical protein
MKKEHIPTPAPVSSSYLRWGYVLGVGSCALGLAILLAAGATSLRSALRGVRKADLPGRTALTLNRPGLYLGLYRHLGEDPAPLRELSQLEILLTDEGGVPVPLTRTPGAAARVGGQAALVLFHAEVPSSGRYRLSSAYPSGVPGPSVEAWLVHESLPETRSELAAGAVVCLVLSVFGVFVLVRTRRLAKASAPAPPLPPRKQ